jgi:hypothetical protein
MPHTQIAAGVSTGSQASSVFTLSRLIALGAFLPLRSSPNLCGTRICKFRPVQTLARGMPRADLNQATKARPTLHQIAPIGWECWPDEPLESVLPALADLADYLSRYLRGSRKGASISLSPIRAEDRLHGYAHSMALAFGRLALRSLWGSSSDANLGKRIWRRYWCGALRSVGIAPGNVEIEGAALLALSR